MHVYIKQWRRKERALWRGSSHAISWFSGNEVTWSQILTDKFCCHACMHVPLLALGVCYSYTYSVHKYLYVHMYMHYFKAGMLQEGFWHEAQLDQWHTYDVIGSKNTYRDVFLLMNMSKHDWITRLKLPRKPLQTAPTNSTASYVYMSLITW